MDAAGAMKSRPPQIAGLRHIALAIAELEACERFYTDLLGYQVEWRPDADNVYLTCGGDSIALHRGREDGAGHLDHLGILLREAGHVDAWFRFLRSRGVAVEAEPRTHRDGARSFYCRDPAGNRVQMIYHPPVSDAM